MDDGTLALTKQRAPGLYRHSNPSVQAQDYLGFTISFADTSGSFGKAADTWKKVVPYIRFVDHKFKSIDDLSRIFRLLEHTAKEVNATFLYGAMFVHSSPLLEGEENSQRRGLHATTNKPRTLAELRYIEDVLRPQGLDGDTANATVLKSFKPLPWARQAALHLFGCLSGGTPNDPHSIAQTLANSQHVRTIGETGKAYFSKNPNKYIPISSFDREIYLRAFHVKMNLVIEALEGDLSGFLSLGEAMPQRRFEPH